MAMDYASNGLDAIAPGYLKDAIEMALTMQIFGSLSHIESEASRIVYSATAWCLFALQGYASKTALTDSKC